MSGKPKRKMPTQKPAQVAASSGDGKPAKRPVQAPKPQRNIPVLGIVFGAVALLLILAVTLTGNTGPGSEFGEPVVTGNGLPPFQSTAGDGAIGLQGPLVTGEDFSGDPVSIGDSDRPTAIVFLAHWCPHCQAEVPRVQQWLNSGGGVDGVDIVSVTTSINSARPNYPPSDWLEREGWTAPVMLDDTDSSVLRAYGAGGFPYWVFLNADGSVAARTAGELDIATLEQFLQQIATSAA